MLWRDGALRVVAVDDAHYPGYVRVVWNAHVREMSDLDEAARLRCMRAVLAVEGAVRAVFAPDKVNLASLGNVVPHLHWHVIPRYRDDPHFPNPVWGERRRDPDFAAQARRRALLPGLAAAIGQALRALGDD